MRKGTYVTHELSGSLVLRLYPVFDGTADIIYARFKRDYNEVNVPVEDFQDVIDILQPHVRKKIKDKEKKE